jgi:hypothetical protein
MYPYASYAIYHARYDCSLEEDVATIRGKVVFEVFGKQGARIPLVGTNVGLLEASLNKKTSFIQQEGGRYFLVVRNPGSYTLDLEYLVKVNREREHGPGLFTFETMPAPISQLEFIMEETGVEVFIEPAIKVEVSKEAKRTVALAIMPNTSSVTIRWSRALPKEVITPVKLEAKVYADVATLACVGEGLIRCESKVGFSILQAEVSSLRLSLPQDAGVLNVTGANLRDWKVVKENGQQYLDAYLNFGIKGNYELQVSYECTIGEGSVVTEIPSLKVLGVEREKGNIGIAAATNVELAVNKLAHATLIDVKELPAFVWNYSSSPVLLAFKYLNHPYQVTIEVTRHKELPVLIAAVDSASFVTLNTKEGKYLTKAVYQVRNNVKQFIRLKLPEAATLWSAFVSEKPVKPAKDEQGYVLIPLEKSEQQAEGLRQFPVEIVFLGKTKPLGLAGSSRLSLPNSDIPINDLSWSVYFPREYVFFNFSGDVSELKEQKVMLQGLARVSKSSGGALKEKIYAPRERKAKDEGFLGATQFDQYAALEFAKGVETASRQGALPVRIDIPQEGRFYQFSKLLVTQEDTPWLSAVYFYTFPKAHGILGILVAVFCLFVLVFLIRKTAASKAKDGS